MSRADEWHIKIRLETKRRYKANAALHGLTLGDNLERLLDLDEVGEGGRATGMGVEQRRERPTGRAGAAGLRTAAKADGSSQGHDQRRPLDAKSDE